ncbi:MAG TPA: diphthine--ammonia ligase [Caulobacteraceae bacterium]|nr:diphthine--ammonia ligase [Caulobacteraceae bacterium]
MTPVLMSWSGGKDSCVALHDLQRSGDYEVAGLLTTVTRDYGRISMHGVRRELLARQARALGLPLHEVFIPAGASNDDYEAAVARALATQRARGVETVAFGDLYLADIRAYRDRMMAKNGMRALYPVWGRDTRAFIEDFIAEGFEAVIVCVDLSVLDASFAGRAIDAELLYDLPAGIDPCGENGEFHTFVFDGPNFASRLDISIGERVVRERFCFCDLTPVA